MNTPEHLAPRLPLAALTSPSLPGPPSPGVARFPGAPHTGPEVSPPGLPLGALTQPPNPFDVPPTFDALLAQFPPALSADVLRISLVDQAPEPPPAPAPVAEPAPAPAAAPIAPAPAFASAHDFTVPLTFDAPAPAPRLGSCTGTGLGADQKIISNLYGCLHMGNHICLRGFVKA